MEKDKYHVILLKGGIKKKKPVNKTKQKQIHRHKGQLVATKGEGGWGGIEWETGLADVSFYIYNG